MRATAPVPCSITLPGFRSGRAFWAWTAFCDRLDAAQQLADRLASYRGKNPLVLGIPRGAVPMAECIARELAGEFDVVLLRKLRAPWQPELAIGSVDESGWTYLSDHAAAYGGTP